MVLRPVRREPSLLRQQRGYFIIDQYKPRRSDPYFGTVVNLTHFENYYGSPKPDNYGLTNSCPRGNQISLINGSGNELTGVKKVFGDYSLRRLNTDGPGISAALSGQHTDYKFGTYDWTVEFRYQIDNVAAANYNIFDMRVAGGTPAALTIYTYTNGRLGFYVSGAERIVSAASTIASNTWYAIAVSRVSGSTRLFVNGTQVGSTYTDSINYNASARIALGSDSNANPPNANWDELRISNGLYGAGAGRYAANYTIDTEAFPDA